MNDTWVEDFVERFFDTNGREPTDLEIQNSYGYECDCAYDNYIDGLIDEHRENMR
jgi:hypothetical protein